MLPVMLSVLETEIITVISLKHLSSALTSIYSFHILGISQIVIFNLFFPAQSATVFTDAVPIKGHQFYSLKALIQVSNKI